ncbi:MAG: hypothetical protein Rubg2KO_21540 [Rubricoccaceae bacterium]
MPPTSVLILACVMLGACAHHGAFPFRASEPDAPLPPNTVRLDAQVQFCDAAGEATYTCQLIANRVIGYGRGGAVTPPGTPLEAAFSHRDLEIERPPEDGAQIDVLILIDTPPGVPREYRATRLYSYTPPN